MSESIIIAALSFLGTLSGAYIANRKSTALLDFRLNILEKKMDEHNKVIARTYALEKRAEVIDEKINAANHRIADLESAERK